MASESVDFAVPCLCFLLKRMMEKFIYFSNLCDDSTSRVLVGNDYSPEFTTGLGVCQDCPLFIVAFQLCDWDSCGNRLTLM